MSDRQPAMDERAAELREAFDRSFSLPLLEQAEAKERFLILGAGGDRYAVRLDGLAGVEKCRKIAPLPLRAPGLLGLAGFRGQLTAVFRLASLLDIAAGDESPAWLAFCKGATPLALAFDRFEGAVDVPSQVVHATETKGRASQSGRQTVRIGSDTLHVIDVPSLAAAARQSLAAAGGKSDPRKAASAAGIPG